MRTVVHSFYGRRAIPATFGSQPKYTESRADHGLENYWCSV